MVSSGMRYTRLTRIPLLSVLAYPTMIVPMRFVKMRRAGSRRFMYSIARSPDPADLTHLHDGPLLPSRSLSSGSVGPVHRRKHWPGDDQDEFPFLQHAIAHGERSDDAVVDDAGLRRQVDERIAKLRIESKQSSELRKKKQRNLRRRRALGLLRRVLPVASRRNQSTPPGREPESQFPPWTFRSMRAMRASISCAAALTSSIAAKNASSSKQRRISSAHLGRRRLEDHVCQLWRWRAARAWRPSRCRWHARDQGKPRRGWSRGRNSGTCRSPMSPLCLRGRTDCIHHHRDPRLTSPMQLPSLSANHPAGKPTQSPQ